MNELPLAKDAVTTQFVVSMISIIHFMWLSTITHNLANEAA